MKLSSFGGIQIAVTPHADNPQIMSVDIAAQNRMDAVSMTTNKDETVDQFTGRLRSMLRGLWNSEPRVSEADKKAIAKEEKKPPTWEQQQQELKDKVNAGVAGAAGTAAGTAAGAKK